MIDHCVSLFNKRAKEESYKNYIADTLKLINDNLAKRIGGSFIQARYSELTKRNNEPEKSGDEIARDIIRRAGLKVKK